MTEKVYPSSLILLDLVLTEEEEAHISGVLGEPLDSQTREKLQLELGKYIAAVKQYYVAAKPSQIKKELDKFLRKAKPLRRDLAQLLDIDDVEELIRDSVAWGEPDELAVLSPIFGESIENGRAIDPNDNRAALGNLIDAKLEESQPTEGISIYLVYKLVQVFESALQELKDEISSSGGAPGDPYLDEFLVNINKCYQLTGRSATYTAEAIQFVAVVRDIVAARLRTH